MHVSVQPSENVTLESQFSKHMLSGLLFQKTP